jgi:superfamily II DNA or RNA helicase
MTDSVLGTSLADIEPAAFGRLVERLLWHLDFTEVSNVDGPGDRGADIVALRGAQRWVFQAKLKKRAAVDVGAVEELRVGLQEYDASRGAVVTTTGYTTKARARAEQLRGATGVRLDLWGGEDLVALYADDEAPERFAQPALRAYQIEAFQAARHDLKKSGSAFLVLATGLGKTVIAGEVLDWYLSENPGARILVLAHTRDLVDQLERALWRHVPKNVPTQQVHGGEKPQDLRGITVATVQSAVAYVRQGFRPDFIFVDEAHHAGELGTFAEVLTLCPEALRLGATATPWRGDEFDVAHFFGSPSYKIGIEEGMRLGFLVDVDYRLFVDNIDWDYVRSLSANEYSIKELNRHLFLPQRDERVRDELLDVWNGTTLPRAIVFCQTIDHAERMLGILQGVPAWRRATAIHNRLTQREQKTRLTKFRLGDIPLLIAVDILNEGVDVPDVNIICFARMTHSRRIFIQQLGRGLRLSDGKTHVTVLDFVSDLRRVAAVMGIRSQVAANAEEVMLPSSHSISFNNAQAESLLAEWIKDAADLETAADEVRLNFPPIR